MHFRTDGPSATTSDPACGACQALQFHISEPLDPQPNRACSFKPQLPESVSETEEFDSAPPLSNRLSEILLLFGALNRKIVQAVRSGGVLESLSLGRFVEVEVMGTLRARAGNRDARFDVGGLGASSPPGGGG